uniref:Ion_trans domain-containing protein n=1 Tax=Steinernema glaseri TaxID=37863 RepID=A0A1I7YD69_9BILA
MARGKYDPLEGIPSERALQAETVAEDFDNVETVVTEEDHDESEELSDVSEEEESSHWRTKTRFSVYTLYANVRPLMKSPLVRVLTLLNSCFVIINLLLILMVVSGA